MRAVVLCAEPERVRGERDSLAFVLADLGCDVALGRFDLGGLDLPALA